ncbi:hypothetical protein ACEWY4_016865 [Coilia grayii]|uniref:Reverse transcriptase/retrotransposon-derived protein RNase H-like domain-containing protein n=1 Tax=Coilia grayii TaxID=363190 RepID=A0ABD1JLM2_9TELE
MVLQRLQHHNLKLKLKKCKFFQSEGSYLGHVISASRVATDPEKIQAVAEWKRPSIVKELRSFLGFATYYQRFAGFAAYAAPIHKLVGALEETRKRPGPRLRGQVSQHWSQDCEDAFQALKSHLVQAPGHNKSQHRRAFPTASSHRPRFWDNFEAGPLIVNIQGDETSAFSASVCNQDLIGVEATRLGPGGAELL